MNNIELNLASIMVNDYFLTAVFGDYNVKSSLW